MPRESRTNLWAMVDAFTEPFPDPVSRYLRSGFAPQGEVWAWWVAGNGDMCTLLRLAASEPPRFELAVFPPSTGAWGHELNGVSLSMAALSAITAGGLVPGLAEVMPPAVREAVHSRLTGAGPGVRRAARAGYQSASRTAVSRLDAQRFEAWRQLGASIGWAAWSRLMATAHQQPEAAELLEEIALPAEAPEVLLQPLFAPVLFVLCAAECSQDTFIIQKTDSYFGDLERLAIPTSTFGAEAATAWHLFQSCVDVSATKRSWLPVWLRQLTVARSASVGLLSPSEVQMVVASRVVIERALEGKTSSSDTRELFEVFEAAAKHGDWVLGFEPST